MDETVFSERRDGQYKVFVTDAGVSLSVWPPTNGGLPVSISAIVQELADQNFTHFDNDFLDRIIREAIGKPILIVNASPPLDGRYQFSATDAGLYLSVWAPANGGAPVSKSAVIHDLNRQNCNNYDSAFLSRVISEALGYPILIASTRPPLDGRYQFSATDAGLYLSVWAPANDGSPVSKSAVIQDLNSQKCNNYDSDFLSRVISEALGKPILIAGTLPPLDGRYQIAATDVGLHLSVWAPANGGSPVSKAAVIQDLSSQKCSNYDSDFLSRVISEALGKPILIANELPPLNGRYQLAATDAGVSLSVWPSANGGVPVSKAAIIQELTNQNLINFDSDFISTVIREAAGIPVFIVSSLPTPVTAQYIRVKVGFDRLEARVDVTIPPEAPPLTMSQLLAELESAGVVFGIEIDVLERLTRTRMAKNVVCAQGIPPCTGDDAVLKYHVDPDSQGRPVELEDGRVDFKEINNFLCVEEGQLLVEKIPATPGIPGTDVFGAPLPAKPGRDVKMPVGNNVITVDDWRLYAGIDGHLNIFFDKRINVLPIIIIDGDVDHSTGNIDFRGSVLVRGSVQPDFVVKAGGNVEVWGTISGGMVEANNIIVRKGIQGMNRSVIRARERLVATFIESATVYADQDVVVSDVILTSSVFAGMRVMVEGRRGLIRGGRVSAGELIRASTIGNQSGVVTELEVAVSAVLKDELLNLRQEIKKSQTLCEELKLSLTFLRNKGLEHLSADKSERYRKNEAEYSSLPYRIEEMRQRISDIETLLRGLKPGKIRVSNVIYPGSKIYIGALTKIPIEPLKYVSFYVRDGEIKVSSF